RVIIDIRLVQATQRCLLLWHRLQEHGGIHNSHAEQALARERAAWEVQRQQELDALKPDAGAPAAEDLIEPGAAAPVREGAGTAEIVSPPSDQPWIETSRCSSCNECRNINDKMFGYNENQQ